jgi:membrane protein DedA with SNARE-associated domain
MNFLINSDSLVIHILISITVLLYVFLLILLIVKEINNTNTKIHSFLWIFSSFIFPVIPFIYIILLLIEKKKK